MHKLTDWRAKRAGGRMTVYGKNERGEDAKVVGVDRIERVQHDKSDARMTFAIIDHVNPPLTYHLVD